MTGREFRRAQICASQARRRRLWFFTPVIIRAIAFPNINVKKFCFTTPV